MKPMLLVATALAVLSGAAQAQTSTSGSNSQSTANTRSSSQSVSYGNSSRIIVNTYAGVDGSGNSSTGGRTSTGSSGSSGGANGANGTNAVDPAGANGLNGANGSGGDPAYSINYSGGYSVRNVPEVIPPSINGGNPCAVGASGGLAVSGFGISGGATWADKQCERRQQAALLFNIGKQKAAVELMCQDDNVRAALRVSGEPCTLDQSLAAAPTPAIAAAPQVPAIATPVANVSAPVATHKARPEWCYTASADEVRRHAECDVRS